MKLQISCNESIPSLAKSAIKPFKSSSVRIVVKQVSQVSGSGIVPLSSSSTPTTVLLLLFIQINLKSPSEPECPLP